MSITLRQIRYFVAAAESGKVTEAAASIGISASAVTSAIQELESMLGVSLFDRHHKGLKLTYNGYHFLQHCQNILSAVSTAMHTFKDRKQYSGKLKLGVSPTVSGYFLTPLLSRFGRAFPNVNVEILELKRQIAESKIANDQIDIAILLVSNAEESDQLSREVLVSSKRKVWTATDHPLLQKKSISLNDIATYPYVQLTIDEAAKSHMNYWEMFNLKPNIVFETSVIEAVRSMVATGEGITILSDMVYRPWSLEGERIESRSIVDDIPSMDVGLMWMTKKELPELTQAFIEFCRMEYNSGQAR
jgi:DNA-binding transcriptional LysR family regulator